MYHRVVTKITETTIRKETFLNIEFINAMILMYQQQRVVWKFRKRQKFLWTVMNPTNERWSVIFMRNRSAAENAAKVEAIENAAVVA